MPKLWAASLLSRPAVDTSDKVPRPVDPSLASAPRAGRPRATLGPDPDRPIRPNPAAKVQTTERVSSNRKRARNRRVATRWLRVPIPRGGPSAFVSSRVSRRPQRHPNVRIEHTLGPWRRGRAILSEARTTAESDAAI